MTRHMVIIQETLSSVSAVLVACSSLLFLLSLFYPPDARDLQVEVSLTPVVLENATDDYEIIIIINFVVVVV